MLTGNEHTAAHPGAIDHVEHRRYHARLDLLDLHLDPHVWKSREHFRQTRHPNAFAPEWTCRAVERERPARIGGRHLRICHLADDTGATASALEMVVVTNDDFAVARHVNVAI